MNNLPASLTELDAQFDELVFLESAEVRIVIKWNGVEVQRVGQHPVAMQAADWATVFDAFCVYKVVVELNGNDTFDMDVATKEGLIRVLQRYRQLHFEHITPDGLDKFCDLFGSYV